MVDSIALRINLRDFVMIQQIWNLLQSTDYDFCNQPCLLSYYSQY